MTILSARGTQLSDFAARASAGKLNNVPRIRRKRRHRPPPEAIDDTSQLAALRAIATLEALKGAVVFAAAFGMLALLHKDAPDVADHILRALHFNPEGHISQVFLRAADKVTDAKLWAASAGALLYSVVRFIEAYGLWCARVWAEWFALLSGMIYLPWEIYELIARATPIRWGLLLVNLTIILYMLHARLRASRPLPE